jgi:hypothetical protein
MKRVLLYLQQQIWVDETNSYINSGNGGSGNLIFNEAITVSSGGNLTGVGTISSGAITSTSTITASSHITITGDNKQLKFTGTAGPLGLEFGDSEANPNFRVYYRTTPNTLTFENNAESAKHTFDLSGNYTSTGDITSGDDVIVGDLLIMAGGNTKAIAFTGTGSDTNVRHFAYEASDHHYVTNRHTNGDLILMSNNGTGGGETARMTLQAGSGTQDIDITNANLDLNSNNITGVGTISSGAITSSSNLTLGANGIIDTASGHLIFKSGGATQGQFISTGFSLIGSYSATGNYNTSLGSYQIGGTTVIDSSRNLLNLESISLADSKQLNIGSGPDLIQYHNGSNSFIQNFTGGLYIDQALDNGNMIFRNDNGSGGLTAYMTLEGGNERVSFNKKTIHHDNVLAVFGSDQDLQIYHDGTQSIITDTGTGQLKILAENILYI